MAPRCTSARQKAFMKITARIAKTSCSLEGIGKARDVASYLSTV
jgi:hypothetical protein